MAWIATALAPNTAGLSREWVGFLCVVKKQEQEMRCWCGCFASETATAITPAGVVELAAGRDKDNGKATGVPNGKPLTLAYIAEVLLLVALTLVMVIVDLTLVVVLIDLTVLELVGVFA